METNLQNCVIKREKTTLGDDLSFGFVVKLTKKLLCVNKCRIVWIIARDMKT
jgi:hypothetical protein